MKSILKKVSGIAAVAVLVLGMIGCANGNNAPVLLPVATPVLSVAAGEVKSGTSVEITCETEGAVIHYTTDGKDPTAESATYSKAISLTEAVTIKAIAVKYGMIDSAVASAAYTIKGSVATPAFSVAAGAVKSGTSVEITCGTEGAVIHYTTDGKDPTAESATYSKAISLTEAVTIKAIAVKDGMVDSAVASAAYTIKGTVATPAFSVKDFFINSGTPVEISCGTEGAVIHYTTDGSTPTAESTKYTAAIKATASATATMTIKAIAVKDGMNDSVVASVEYEVFNCYETMIDAESGNAASASSTYVYFGVFPKTVLPKTSPVTIDETKIKEMGANTYYRGSDGNWYAKVTEKGYGSEYKYSDNTDVKRERDGISIRFFKVEPIKWKVLTTNYNGTEKALLLAEEILTGVVYYFKCNSVYNTRSVDSDTKIYPNNYKYSQIRAYLNGLDYYYDKSGTETTKKTDYTDKGFLQTAFTASAQSLIETTTVDNSGESTTNDGNNQNKADGTEKTKNNPEVFYPDFTCANTADKIFLLSEKEITTTAYGFKGINVSDNARIRTPTDYAKANFASYDEDLNAGKWWLRSPLYKTLCDESYVFDVLFSGFNDFNNSTSGVDSDGVGVVPALTISF